MSYLISFRFFGAPTSEVRDQLRKSFPSVTWNFYDGTGASAEGPRFETQVVVEGMNAMGFIHTIEHLS